MIKTRSRNEMRELRHRRLRKRLAGTPECPRLSVFHNLKHIYAQVIDDEAGKTLLSASTLEKTLATSLKNSSDQEAAKSVGLYVAAPSKTLVSLAVSRRRYVSEILRPRLLLLLAGCATQLPVWRSLSACVLLRQYLFCMQSLS